MIDFSRSLEALSAAGLTPWSRQLQQQLQRRFFDHLHGDLPGWLDAISELPKLGPGNSLLDRDEVAFVPDTPASSQDLSCLEGQLKRLHPWRKGPYRIDQLLIDTEWRSDWKWRRLLPHIAPLQGRRVLDVGGGNGYHGWRMLGAGAALVVNIDPTQLFLAQFLAIQGYLGEHWPIHQLPLGIEDLPSGLQAFDSVFSMGVLYHRRSPIDHLYALRGALRSGGELILETLVIDGPEGSVFLPPGRYAKMRNVWFLPSALTLEGWLKRCGFRNPRLVSDGYTSTEEQRRTEWMRFESLADYLDPQNPGQTIEGHPAPRRAILLAEAP